MWSRPYRDNLIGGDDAAVDVGMQVIMWVRGTKVGLGATTRVPHSLGPDAGNDVRLPFQ